MLGDIHRHDMLIITGDMNAEVGNNSENYEDIMGGHGAGMRNENGVRLCDFCAMNRLIITGTIFPRKEIHKLTWVSSDGSNRNQIDHTLINRKFRSSVRDTRVYRGADVASDHYLVKTTIKLKLKTAPKDNRLRTKYDTDKLNDMDIRRRYCLTLRNRYQVLEDEGENEEDIIESQNAIMKKAIKETAKEVLGVKKKRKSKP